MNVVSLITSIPQIPLFLSLEKRESPLQINVLEREVNTTKIAYKLASLSAASDSMCLQNFYNVNFYHYEFYAAMSTFSSF